MKILQLNEKDSLPVQLKLFHHLPIHNEKYVPDEFKKEKYSYCINNPLIKVERKELQQFESQEVSTYAENCYNNDTILDNYFAMDDINENVGLTNKIKPNSILIDIFKDMTNHLEYHCTVDDINEIRAYMNNKIVE